MEGFSNGFIGQYLNKYLLGELDDVTSQHTWFKK